jgi:hypothetical protein
MILKIRIATAHYISHVVTLSESNTNVEELEGYSSYHDMVCTREEDDFLNLDVMGAPCVT